MKPDLAASVADRDDATGRAAAEGFAGFGVQNQAVRGCRDGADVDALDTEQRIRARAPAATGTRHRVIHVSRAGTASLVPSWNGKICWDASLGRWPSCYGSDER
jgi:hypothetical protein